MTRVAAAVVIALALQQLPTFRSTADAVTVEVSVRDGAKVVSNLRAEHFELLDNGVPQTVTALSYGKLPIDITLALDTSYSVTGALLNRLREAVLQLMRDLGPEDRLRLIDFNMRIVKPVDYTADAGRIADAIRSVSGGGGSSIRDALAVALVSASHPGRRQLIVAFTDAADSTSITTGPALIDLARRSTASIATVLPGAPGPGLQARQGVALLRDLARETGGTVLEASVPSRRTTMGTRTTITMGGQIDLTGQFRKVLDDFRSSYVLHFIPSGVEAAGFHTLDVKVRGRASLTVRARRGYER